eukprot:TRINITY_DN34469_c0_g1_i1.p1 TRINITY_DN34469_c0_g1~~TRINITY_DN34469_c0_g1_i1.p1  ORF type:complete len:248 (+),score=37.12 TRINITY_DN34469_c0_g1_i1:48-746(+)
MSRFECRPSVRGDGLMQAEHVGMKKSKRKVVELKIEVKEALQAFRFGDTPSPRSVEAVAAAPVLGVSGRAMREMAMPPETFNMRCPGFEELEGTYHLAKEIFNGMPTWQSGPATLYSSKEGLWSVVDTANGPASDLGWITSVDVHGGMMPHVTQLWQAYAAGEWGSLTFVPFVSVKKEVKKRNNRAQRKRGKNTPKPRKEEKKEEPQRLAVSIDEGSLGPSEGSAGSDFVRY